MKATCANHTTSKWKSWDFIPILYDSNSMSLDKRIYCFSSQTVLADSISTKILNILKKKKSSKSWILVLFFPFSSPQAILLPNLLLILLLNIWYSCLFVSVYYHYPVEILLPFNSALTLVSPFSSQVSLHSISGFLSLSTDDDLCCKGFVGLLAVS